MNTKISVQSAMARTRSINQPIDTDHRPLNAELIERIDQWLEQELVELETAFAQYVTHRSYKGWVGR